MKKVHLVILLGALGVGFLARLPGVFWGFNFPTGWHIHHSDEYTHWVIAEHMIAPFLPPRWDNPYPKGLAAEVALPAIVFHGLTGQLHADPPGIIPIVVTGRVINVLYGIASILILFLLARRLFKDMRIALFTAWILALGGLHVTQSHFFVADVPELFWFLSGSYLLFLEYDNPGKDFSPYLMGAAFCFGIGFGIKFLLIGIPTLLLIAVLKQPRILRLIYAGVFFVAGALLINMGAFSYYDLFQVLTKGGIGDPYIKNSLVSVLLYFVELPSILSFPIVILAAFGAFYLAKKYISSRSSDKFWSITLIVILPLLIHAFLLVFKLDHFPRHFLPFIPWIAIAAAWSLTKLVEFLSQRNLTPTLAIIPIFLYLVLFVYDGERVFIQEPRNQAENWLLQNLTPGGSYSWREHDGIPGYKSIYYPSEGRPDFILIDMHHANHYLSGMGLKNSLPNDYRYIFDSGSQANVDALQGLFTGSTEYREVARFREGYFMPDYFLVDGLIGNRSRNYVAEVVIFKK